jgi:aryl-alcohol dehydrogenase-like predicted oxidoreductase
MTVKRHQKASKLVLGAAQLGSNYGISNTTGQPSLEECKKLIDYAIQNGVAYIDTARAYGNSETVIGESLKDGLRNKVKVITKLSPLQDCPKDASIPTIAAFVDASVFQSCRELKVESLQVVMLHRATHIDDWNGAVLHRLLELQKNKVIVELGVSVQNPQELLSALDVPQIAYIQLPFNLLDWRWEEVIPKIVKTKASRKLNIHVRSALLQGLLLSSEEKYWQQANIDNNAEIRTWLLEMVSHFKRVNIADLCLNYLNALAWVDGIALGMENMEQMNENLHYFSLAPLSLAQVDVIQATRPKLTQATLNPSLWRK